MATFSTYASGEAVLAKSGSNAAGAPAYTVFVGEFDASKRNLAAADVMQVVDIPAGTVVMNVAVEIQTVDATQTVNVGDGGDVDGWVAAASVATAGYANGGGAYVAAGGKLYATADTIDIEVPATKALDTFKGRILVYGILLG